MIQKKTKGYQCCGAKAESRGAELYCPPGDRNYELRVRLLLQFLVMKPSIRIRNDLKMPDPDPRINLKCWIRIETNAALQHW